MSPAEERILDRSSGCHRRHRRHAAPRGITRPAVLISGGVAVAAALVLMLRLPSLAWRVEQPLGFSHRLHLEEVGLECVDCHRQALTGVRATIPNISVCGDCHDAAVGESPDELALVAHVEAGERIPWRKVYRVPDDVFFSHRRHTTLGGLDCAVCHGAVGESAEPVTRPFRRPTMDDCMDCHEESQVSNDCIYCHY